MAVKEKWNCNEALVRLKPMLSYKRKHCEGNLFIRKHLRLGPHRMVDNLVGGRVRGQALKVGF